MYYKFIKIGIAFLILCLVSISACQPTSSSHGQPADEIILGVNAYSFNDLLSARSNRSGEPVYTLFNLLDWCALRNIKALDPTAYFFPTYPEVPSDEYLTRIKNYADSLGVAISGTGIRNNFASPDPEERAAGVALAKKWCVAASKMGAPVLRVFAGKVPEGYENNWEEPAGWIIDCLKELMPMAEQYNIKIGVQNHGDMLQTARECKYILEKVDSEWLGLIVDTGSFTTADPYQDIAEVVPYAVNWQVKESPQGLGGKERTDFVKLLQLIKAGGYQGYLPVETLWVKGEPYDPFGLVRQMLWELEQAQGVVYGEMDQ